MINHSQIQSLHSSYCALTGIVIPLSMPRIYQWEAWSACGYTENDLVTVIHLLKEKMRLGRKTIACFRFTNLIGNTEWFEEDLGEARAVARKPVRCAERARVLEASGRSEEKEVPVRNAGDILAGMKAFEEFRAFKASL